MMKRKVGRIRSTKKVSQLISLKNTTDGLHLADSILWFDSKDNGDLSFLSSAWSKIRPNVPQVITTEETSRILEAQKRKTQALVCQYNRPFSIGQLKMELLPSGCVLGGASLYVETEKGRILYAPFLQSQKINTVRQMQLKKAHTLVLGAMHPEPNLSMPNRKKEKENLLKTVKRELKKGQFPVILCEPMSTAQDITKLLTDNDIEVAVHDSIFKVNNVYESYGSKLGCYFRYSRFTKRKRVTLFPIKHGTQNLRTKLPEGPIIYIEDVMTKSASPDAHTEVAHRFYLGSTCDGPEIREVINAVRPKELYFLGPYAKQYVDEFEGICPSIIPLYADQQPTLF